jgi:hypothetical protein
VDTQLTSKRCAMSLSLASPPTTKTTAAFAELSWQYVVDENYRVGYVYDYEPSQGLDFNSQLFKHYELHSDPVERGKSGFKSFYVGDNGSIRWNDERVATAIDPVPDVDPVLDMHSYWTEGLRRWKKKP